MNQLTDETKTVYYPAYIQPSYIVYAPNTQFFIDPIQLQNKESIEILAYYAPKKPRVQQGAETVVPTLYSDSFYGSSPDTGIYNGID